MPLSEDYVYCPLCSQALERIRNEGQARMKCPACEFVHYRNPAPAAGVIMLDGASVLLVKRRFDPYEGKWAIPSGFIEYTEDVRETAVREVREETGLEIEIVALETVESCFDDPRGNTLLVLFTGRITGGELAAGDDAADVGYFPLDALPEIAFEAHRRVLDRLARSR
jgi:ADP-ribose pyrophosphatase YjhB (NUDIX family)